MPLANAAEGKEPLHLSPRTSPRPIRTRAPTASGQRKSVIRVGKHSHSDASKAEQVYLWIAVAAWTIAMKESALRDAPPTKAPSILGCPRSSAALSALTLPPY